MDSGSNQGLGRTLGLFPVTSIVIANMIGAGIFTTSGLLMRDLQSPSLMILLWIVGGGIALCGALSYGALGSAMPHAGGEYVFLSRLYHPTFGFLSGWVSFVVGFSAPIAASSIGVSEYFARAFPEWLAWSTALGIENPAIAKKLLSILVILVFTVIHFRGIELGTKVQNALTVLKVGLIAALLILGFLWGRGEWDHFAVSELFAFDLEGWKKIGLSLMWIMFAYSGWNASTYIGSEIQNPTKTLPRSLVLGTVVVLLLYLLLNVLFVYAASPDQMAGVISIGGLAMGNLFGGSMERLFSVLIGFALFSSLSAFIILGPRVYYSMAKDGYFFNSVARVHPRFGVPANSIALQGLLASVMVLSGTFDQVLTYMGFSLGIFPIIAVLGVFRLEIRHRAMLPGYPLVPIMFILASVTILVLAFLERPIESSIALLTAIAGIPMFYLFRRAHRSKE